MRTAKADSWSSTLTGIGDVSRDKRLSKYLVGDQLTTEGGAEAYGSSDMAARIVDALPEEALREGFSVRVEDDLEKAEKLEARLAELNAAQVLEDAAKKERIFGGAGILLGLQGESLNGMMLPLDSARVSRVNSLNVFDARELRAVAYYDNPLEPKFGLPKMFDLAPRVLGSSYTGAALFKVHESRLIRFCGPTARREDLLTNSGWGASVLDLVFSKIRDFDSVHDNAAALVEDFSQAIYKLKGLHEAIAANRGADVIERIKTIDLSRSTIRGILLDADEEDFERKPTPISGLAELIDRFANRLAAAAKMPVALLMGQAPAGLNATGASDTRFYYDSIKAYRQRKIAPQLRQLVQLVMAEQGSATGGKVPEKWGVKFPPLWQLTDVEQADVRQKLAAADAVYLDRGVLTPDEVAESRHGAEGLSMDVQTDGESREKYAQEALEAAAELENPRVPADKQAPGAK